MIQGTHRAIDMGNVRVILDTVLPLMSHASPEVLLRNLPMLLNNLYHVEYCFDWWKLVEQWSLLAERTESFVGVVLCGMVCVRRFFLQPRPGPQKILYKEQSWAKELRGCIARMLSAAFESKRMSEAFIEIVVTQSRDVESFMLDLVRVLYVLKTEDTASRPSYMVDPTWNLVSNMLSTFASTSRTLQRVCWRSSTTPTTRPSGACSRRPTPSVASS